MSPGRIVQVKDTHPTTVNGSFGLYTLLRRRLVAIMASNLKMLIVRLLSMLATLRYN